MAAEFVTLPDDAKTDLQQLANVLLVDIRRRGYRTSIEPVDLQLPATPTIVAKRGQETNYFLVRQSIVISEIEQWVRYAQSCTRDTKVTICHGGQPAINGASLAKLIAIGVGVSMRTPGNALQVLSEGRDLAFRAVAPDRRQMKPKVRRLLGEALDRLEYGDWRVAFEDACVALEEQCRAYLQMRRKLRRLQYQQSGRVKVPTERQITKMPLGALKDVFCGMLSQNQIEASLCAALEKLNPDRVRRAHKRRSRNAEDALRRRVGTHFWLINNALSLLV